MLFIVRYAEIGIKGKNRGWFENKLIQNIKLKTNFTNIKKELGTILIESNHDISNELREVFGIAWFAEAEKVSLDINQIKNKVLHYLKKYNPKSFKLNVNRANKSFTPTSLEIAKILGQECEKNNFKFSLKNPDIEIFIDILNTGALIYTKKIQGLGGLPVGTSGKLLCLLSGGIDSPVAAWLMAKRGAKVDFLHFYSLRDLDEVRNSKIIKLVQHLRKYLGSSNLWVIPIWDFQFATLNLNSYELQLFRRFMLKTAQKLVKEKGYDGIILGDSLAQVASQTISNMAAAEQNLEIQIFKPLIAFDKKEIIDLAKKIGTYEISLQPYHDCCAIVAKSPKTSIKKEVLKNLEEKIKLEEIVDVAYSKLVSL
ncbi:MAG: tRNA uracil 4-sulfurtransferase ThiI [Candidatus Nanoarchaeia archaeon]